MTAAMLAVLLGLGTWQVERLHWKQADDSCELEGWVTQMGLDAVRWETVDDETLIGRIPGHFVVVSSLLLPKKK